MHINIADDLLAYLQVRLRFTKNRPLFGRKKYVRRLDRFTIEYNHLKMLDNLLIIRLRTHLCLMNIMSDYV